MCREPCQPATGAGQGGSPWGLISFSLQCPPSPKIPASLPGLQTGPLSCALRKALGVNVSSPGIPNLVEFLLHSSGEPQRPGCLLPVRLWLAFVNLRPTLGLFWARVVQEALG